MQNVLFFNLNDDMGKFCKEIFPNYKTVQMMDFITKKADSSAYLAIIGCSKENYLDIKHIANYFGQLDIVFLSTVKKEYVIKEFQENWLYIQFPCSHKEFSSKTEKLSKTHSNQTSLLGGLFSSKTKKTEKSNLSMAEKILSGEISLEKNLISKEQAEFSKEQQDNINLYKTAKTKSKQDDLEEEKFFNQIALEKKDKTHRILQLTRHKTSKKIIENVFFDNFFDAITNDKHLYCFFEGNPCFDFIPENRVVKIFFKETFDESFYKILAQSAIKPMNKITFSDSSNLHNKSNVRYINLDQFFINILAKIFFEKNTNDVWIEYNNQISSTYFLELKSKKFILSSYPNISFFEPFSSVINLDLLLQISTIWTKNVNTLKETLVFLPQHQLLIEKLFYLLIIMRKIQFLDPQYISLVKNNERNYNILHQYKAKETQVENNADNNSPSRIKQAFGNFFNKFKF